MNPIDKMLAWSQITLSVIFLSGTFVVILIYECGWAHLTVEQARSFDKLIDWLTGAAMLILFFWFQRTRMGGIPDSSATITQSKTSPDGTVTAVKSPAHLPLPQLPNPTPPVAAKP